MPLTRPELARLTTLPDLDTTPEALASRLEALGVHVDAPVVDQAMLAETTEERAMVLRAAWSKALDAEAHRASWIARLDHRGRLRAGPPDAEHALPLAFEQAVEGFARAAIRGEASALLVLRLMIAWCPAEALKLLRQWRELRAAAAAPTEQRP